MKGRPSKKIYHYILISILISLSLSVFLSAFFITNRYQNIFLERIKESESDRLIQASSTSNFMTEYAMNLALQIYFNPSFSKALFFGEYNENDTASAIAQLNHIRLSTSFIDSIYLYNHLVGNFMISSSRPEKTVQNREEFSDRFVAEVMDDTTFQRQNSIYNGKALFIPRELELKMSNQPVNTVYTLIYKNKFVNSELPGVIINISSRWFEENLFKNINRHDERVLTHVFAIDNDNRVVIKNRFYPVMQDVSEEEWFGDMTGSGLSSGYLIAPIEGELKLINYYKSDNLQIDWMFISVKSYSSLIGDIIELRGRIILFSLILLSGTLLIEIIVSNRLYRPINSLFNTLETSHVGREDYKVTLKNNFFRIYLQQKFPMDRNEIKEEFRKFQITLDVNRNFMVILLRIDNYPVVSEDNSFYSLSQLKLSVLREISDALAEYSPFHENVILPGKFMLYLCNISEDGENDMEKIIEMIREMRAGISDRCGIIYSLFYSPCETGLETLPSLYVKIMNAARKTAYPGQAIDLSLKDFSKRENAKFDFPMKEVSLLIEGLKKGEEQEKVIERYDSIIGKAGSHSHRALNFCITSLLLEINELIYQLKSSGKFYYEFDVEAILDELESFEDYEVLNNQFYTLFREIVSHQSRVISKNADLIEKVVAIVTQNYTNPLFSIVDIAEKLGLTSAYLGKLYKKNTMQSLNDYITGVKLEKAKELLKNTQESINEIALEVGFSTPNYFHIVFKKKTGMTPQNYRNSHDGMGKKRGDP